MGWLNRKRKSKVKSEKSVTPGNVPQETIFVSKSGFHIFDFNNVEDIFIALQTNPELVSIVGYLAKSFTLGIWEQYRNDKLLENSNLIDLLNNPHPLYGGNELKLLIASNLIAYGRVHLYVNQPGVITSAKGIFLLPTPLVHVMTDKYNRDLLDETDISDIITKYKVNFPDGTINISPSKIITISTASTAIIENGEIIYQSPLKSLDTVLKISPTIYETMYELNFNRGAIGILSSDKKDASGSIPLTEPEKQDIQKQYKKYGTLKDKFHMIFSDSSMKFEAMSAKIKEMLLPEQLLEVKRTIADVLMFDILLLNNNEGKKYDNYAEARESLFTEVLIPIAENVSEQITKFFLFARTNEKVILDYSHLDIFAADQTEKNKAIQSEVNYIIEINTAVSQNTMSYDSAVLLLVRNGFSEEEAKKQITKPISQGNNNTVVMGVAV